jgi:hypothetical protein
MVLVRFSCGTLSLTLPQVSDFVPTGYPGLTNHPKWQSGNPKTLCSTKFRHDSEYMRNPPPRKIMGRSLPIKVPWRTSA